MPNEDKPCQKMWRSFKTRERGSRKLLQKNPRRSQQEQIQQQQQDPVVQMQQMELQMKQQELQHKMQMDAAKLKLDAESLPRTNVRVHVSVSGSLLI